MRRINNRTVELTEVEERIKARFEEHLDEGDGIPRATLRALSWARRPESRIRTASAAVVSEEFVAYLSDGTITWPIRSQAPQLTEFGRRVCRGFDSSQSQSA